MGADVIQLLSGLGALVFLLTTLVLARVLPGETSLRLWAAAAVIITVSNVVGGLRTVVEPEALLVIVSITLGVAGGVLLYEAIRATFGRPAQLRWVAIGAAFGLAYATLFTLVWPNLAIRTAVSGALSALFGVMVARVFWQAREPGLGIALRLTGVIMFGVGVAFALRGVVALTGAVNNLEQWDDSAVVSTSYIALTLACIWTSAVIVMIVSTRLRLELDEAKAFAEDANARLVEMSWVDPLTGLATRARIMAVLESEVRLAHTADTALSTVLISVSPLEHASGRPGHRAVDAALLRVATIANEHAPEESLLDVVGRWGHDEFLVVLPRAEHAAALSYAEQVRQSAVTTTDGPVGAFTCTYAVTSLHSGDTADDLLTRLDVAIYRAKDAGPNSIEVS